MLPLQEPDCAAHCCGGKISLYLDGKTGQQTRNPFRTLLRVCQFPGFENLVLKQSQDSESHASNKCTQHLMCHSALLTLTYTGKDGVQGGKAPLLYIPITLQKHFANSAVHSLLIKTLG